MTDQEVRQRAGKTPNKTSKASRTPTDVEDTGRVISVLDILRILVTAAAAALACSYYLTSGESLTYGYKPWFTNLAEVKQYFQGPLQLTPAQLAQYNGQDPSKPIYMAVNGTIYDVSASPQMYGPGGGYSVFAGRDATRAFVTGCFMEDRTSDLRGAEFMFMPIDDPDEVISTADRKKRALRELKEAKERVLSEVDKWASFYDNSGKYFAVGKLVGQKEYKGPAPRLCAAALKGRPKRKIMNENGGQLPMDDHSCVSNMS